MGQGTTSLLSGGCYPHPDTESFPMPGGFVDDEHVEPFDHHRVREHPRYSWFTDHGPTPELDHDGRTRRDSGRYSHAKATPVWSAQPT